MNEKFQRIKIWDSFIRIYHWLMVAAVAGLWLGVCSVLGLPNEARQNELLACRFGQSVSKVRPAAAAAA